MKHLAWIVVGVVVTALGLSWMSALQEARPLAPLLAAEPPPRGPQRGPAETGRTVRVEPAVEAAPEAPTVVEPLASAVRALHAALGRDRTEERKALGELVRLGSDEALEQAVGALEDPQCTLFGSATEADAVFRPLRSRPPISRFALRALEDRLARHDSHPDHLAGYHRLIARNGGEAGARTLLEHLRASDVALRGSAADAVAELEHREFGSELLAALRDEVELDVVKDLTEALLRWGVEPIALEIRAAAVEPGLALERRAQLLIGLAADLDAEGLRALLDLHDGGETAIRAAVLDALRRVTPNEGLAREDLALMLEPFVIERLTAVDEAEVMAGAHIVDGVAAVRSRAVLAALEGRRAGAAGQLAQVLDEALAHYE